MMSIYIIERRAVQQCAVQPYYAGMNVERLVADPAGEQVGGLLPAAGEAVFASEREDVVPVEFLQVSPALSPAQPLVVLRHEVHHIQSELRIERSVGQETPDVDKFVVDCLPGNQVRLLAQVGRHAERNVVTQHAGLGQREGVTEEGGSVHGPQGVRIFNQEACQGRPVRGGIVDSVVTELAHIDLDPLSSRGTGDLCHGLVPQQPLQAGGVVVAAEPGHGDIPLVIIRRFRA